MRFISELARYSNNEVCDHIPVLCKQYLSNEWLLQLEVRDVGKFQSISVHSVI